MFVESCAEEKSADGGPAGDPDVPPQEHRSHHCLDS